MNAPTWELLSVALMPSLTGKYLIHGGDGWASAAVVDDFGNLVRV